MSRQSSDIMVTSVAIIYGDVEQTIIIIVLLLILLILLILLRDAGRLRVPPPTCAVGHVLPR